MIIYIHIGLPFCGTTRIQKVLDDKRNQLISKDILFPASPGKQNHTRLYMAVTDPENVDPLRWNRGVSSPESQALLRDEVALKLQQEIATTAPQKLILSARQFSSGLATRTELQRLHNMLAPYADEFRIVAHIDEQARVAAANYADQIFEGRVGGLEAELAAAQSKDWRALCLRDWSIRDAAKNALPEVHSPPFWLDYEALSAAWSDVFGKNAVTFRSFDAQRFYSGQIIDEVIDTFDLPKNIGKVADTPQPEQPSAAWLARAREMNLMFSSALQTGRIIPRQLWRRMLNQFALAGDPVAPGSLSAISDHFAPANRRLLKAHPDLLASSLAPEKKLTDWQETPLTRGFRASQYIAVFLPLIDKTTKEERAKKAIVPAAPRKIDPQGALSGLPDSTARGDLPANVQANITKLNGGRFAPHNKLGRVNDEELAAAFTAEPMRKLANRNSGNLIVACMKNEAPYIVEWIAYHRAIGVDNFLIYSNGCEDGTSELLDRLQALGIIQHRNNDGWQGNSPQQFALNRALKEDLVKGAEWIIHIDVDEFINVRCDNGTLKDFLRRVPDATNIAMTWRLFGHNQITQFEDAPVIEQFDTCAPKYCPKPHTVWGFKTMFKNLGAYNKISCHRPNKLNEEFRDQVVWVNGSGMPMGDEIKDKGWRNGINSVGYDLIQLNHYALRSAESFLIKRQRGRALHVDRTIGLNYWVRMDWSDHKDITIKRNLPRMQTEMDNLFEDKKLLNIHQQAVNWHRTKAAELHKKPEFEDLYQQALDTRLEGIERVAYSLALDMES